MIREFECKNCSHRFKADDDRVVKCPHCNSDNIDFVKRHMPRWLPWTILGIIIIGCIGFWLTQKPSPSENQVDQPDFILKDTIEQEQARVADSTYINEGNTIQPSLAVTEKKYDEDGDTYSCHIVVSYPPTQPWKVVIKYRNGTYVTESEDGRFEKLPYSKDDGFYLITLVDRSTNVLLCEEREFPDFPKLDIVKKPWSETDLEKALKASVALIDTPFIANPHKVVVVNKPKGDTSPTKTLRDVQKLMADCALNAKVEKVEHDNMKKISVARIRIDYPTDWMQEDEY